MSLDAISTEYKGFWFRSRTEARWAVFLDTLKVPYRYELQGFKLGSIKYLPDFWLPTWKSYLEIKGKTPDRDEIAKCILLAEASGHHCLLVWGDVWAKEHNVLRFPIDPELSDGLNLYTEFADCRRCDGVWLANFSDSQMSACGIGPHSCGDHDRWPLTGEYATRANQAYRAARQARFEHGR